MTAFSETKSLLAAKTFWGGGVAVVAGVLPILGYAVNPADVAELSELVPAAASAIGGIIAIVGRIVATKRIG